jgi:dihydroflavonol-4-reductase
MEDTALITGATGFVGAHVARRLLDHGFRVAALVRPGSNRSLLQSLDIDWRDGDLRDAVSINRAMSGCSAVFHCAADYRLWSPDPTELYLNNVGGTRNVMKAALAHGVQRVVYTSTVGALGLPEGGGAGNEDTPTGLDRMVGHYKRSKFMAEQLVREMASTGMDVVIVNPSTPVGAGDIKPTPTGKTIVDFLNGNIPAYLDTGLNLVSVEDVAMGHLLAFQRGLAGRRYILGCRNMTLHSMLQTLASITGLPEPNIRLPYAVAWAASMASAGIGLVLQQPPAITPESVRMAHAFMFFDGARAVEELGMPQTPFEQALESAVRWFVDNGYVINRRREQLIRQHFARQ